MTRTYDTGLAGPVRTLIREAIIGLLEPLLREQGGFALGVDSMPCLIPKHVDDSYEVELLEDILNARSPAYLVAVGDMKAKAAGSGGDTGTYEIEVYAVTKHMRHLVLGRLSSDAAAIGNDALDPGIEVMIELARMYLNGQRLGPPPKAGDPPSLAKIASQLALEGERHIVTHRELTIWAIGFSVDVSLESEFHRGATEFITSVLISHHVGIDPVPVADVDSTPVVQTQFPVP